MAVDSSTATVAVGASSTIVYRPLESGCTSTVVAPSSAPAPSSRRTVSTSLVVMGVPWSESVPLITSPTAA